MNPITTSPTFTLARPAHRNPWPIAIIAFFAVFISGVATFITFAVRQRMDLVRPDYYAEEIRFQHQIDRVSRTEALGAPASVGFEAGPRRIRIALPLAHARSQARGEIHFYRPSDARLDHAMALAPDADGVQYVDAGDLAAGYWKVRLHWSVGGEEFFFDQALVIEAKRS